MMMMYPEHFHFTVSQGLHDSRKPAQTATHQPHQHCRSGHRVSHWVSLVMTVVVSAGLSALGPASAIASPEASAQSVSFEVAAKLGPTVAVAGESSRVDEEAIAQRVDTASTPAEIDTSITREYEPVTIYLPDQNTQELVPQSVLVTTDAPVTMAVNQIVDQYEGQDVGITGYEVNVDTDAREAAINFQVDHPWGGDVFQSLSSANQYSLFEAIRETLLTQPVYGIDAVIFQANDTAFDI